LFAARFDVAAEWRWQKTEAAEAWSTFADAQRGYPESTTLDGLRQLLDDSSRKRLDRLDVAVTNEQAAGNGNDATAYVAMRDLAARWVEAPFGSLVSRRAV